MKIAILVSMFPPKWIGGVEIATQNIARHLAQAGNDVYIITSGDNDALGKDKCEGFSVRSINYPKIKVLGIFYFWLKCLFFS